MSPKNWGPPIWLLFHTMVEKMIDTEFSKIGPQLFSIMQQICKLLPCPDCASHATDFLSKVRFSSIKNKEDFKMMVHYFHNTVNKRKGYPQYRFEDLEIYSKYELSKVFYNFSNTFNEKTRSLKLMSQSLARKSLLIHLHDWFRNNQTSFVR
jgi:hypothetical protein